MFICWMDWVPWDDAIVVWAGKQRKLWDSLSELRSSLRERGLERTVLRPALLPIKTAQFTQFFRQVWRHTVTQLRLTDSVQGALPDANVHMYLKLGHGHYLPISHLMIILSLDATSASGRTQTRHNTTECDLQTQPFGASRLYLVDSATTCRAHYTVSLI